MNFALLLACFWAWFYLLYRINTSSMYVKRRCLATVVVCFFVFLVFLFFVYQTFFGFLCLISMGGMVAILLFGFFHGYVLIGIIKQESGG